VIITNPSSSNLVTYSVELLSNYSNTKINNKAVTNDQIFTISTVCINIIKSLFVLIFIRVVDT
jgi:hypothetical protein